MTTITPEIQAEAAIWAEGTRYTAADILRAYSEHLGTAAEPLDIQRFCETVLGIAPGGEPAPTREQIAALQDEAAAAGDDAMVTICAAALDGDPVALAAAAQCISDAAAQRDE